MPTIVGIVGASKAIPANPDALLKYCHSVYPHSEKNEDTLNQAVSENLGYRMAADMQTLSLLVVFNTEKFFRYLSSLLSACNQSF